MTIVVDSTQQGRRSALERARATRGRLASILDSLLASGPSLDPGLLRDLDRFIQTEAYAAALEYEQFILSEEQLDTDSADKG